MQTTDEAVHAVVTPFVRSMQLNYSLLHWLRCLQSISQCVIAESVETTVESASSRGQRDSELGASDGWLCSAVSRSDDETG